MAARDLRLDEMAHEAFNERIAGDQMELCLENLQQDAEADTLAMERKLHIAEAKERETRAELRFCILLEIFQAQFHLIACNS